MTDKNRNESVFKETKMIPVRDFWFLVAIVATILICIIAMRFGSSTKAGDELNFAATAVSIFLAVVAIVITLVDVAGQRHNV
jgi:hypothetical protein